MLEIPIVDNITDKDVSYDKKRIYNEIFNVIYPYIFLQENKNITISFYVNGKQECEDKKNEKEKDVPLIINLDKIKDIDNEPIVLDKQKGPMMLELNARPGLAIQIANSSGLVKAIKNIEKNYPKNLSAEERVNFILNNE